MNKLLCSKHAHTTPRQKKAGEARIVSEVNEGEGGCILVSRRAVRGLTQNKLEKTTRERHLA